MSIMKERSSCKIPNCRGTTNATDLNRNCLVSIHKNNVWYLELRIVNIPTNMIILTCTDNVVLSLYPYQIHMLQLPIQ